MSIEKEACNELNYYWIAKYSDGTELRQFDFENDIENHFGKVNKEMLVEFVLEKKDKSKTFSINLKTGLFSINGKEVDKIKINNEEKALGKRISEKEKVKIIYFRRVLRTINTLKKDFYLNNIFHFLGWHGIINGKHEKFEIAISNNTDELMIPPKDNFTPL